MANHTITVLTKTQQTSRQRIGQAQASATGGRQSSAIQKSQLTQAIELGKLVGALGTASEALKSFGETVNKLIPNLTQNAGLKAGVKAVTTIGSAAMKRAQQGALIGSVVPGKGTLIGAGVGAVAGTIEGVAELNAEQEEETKKIKEEAEKKRKKDAKARKQYLFEGELTDFQAADRGQQLDTLQKWSAELNKLKQAEIKAREDLKNGGSVEQYEHVQKQLEQAENRLNTAAGIYDSYDPESEHDSFTTDHVNFMDNMSKMGLYMSGGFAAGQGDVEVQVLKEQKDILKKIEKNTANTTATYS